MAQVWFQDRSSVEGLFSRIDHLSASKENWAVAVADVPETIRLQVERQEKADALVVYKCTKHDLRSQIDAIQDAPGYRLTSQALDAMEMAGLSRSRWKSGRQSSHGGKAGAAFQASMTTFSQFLENFSGIVGIAQAADQQYGGLAYGTLSLLLSVFVHKTEREEALAQGFDEISLALPRLETLQGLRQDTGSGDSKAFQRLEDLITSTFYLVLVYARETTEYYSSKRRRWKDTLRSSQSKEKTIVDIRETLSEIRNECDVLMLTRITILQREIRHMSINVEATHVNVQATHAKVLNNDRLLTRARDSSDMSHLANLRSILGVSPKGSRNTGPEACERYKLLLQRELFARQDMRYKHIHPSKVSMELLRADEEFLKWWDLPRSCLLLAGGANSTENYTSGSLNWLSYGAILAIEEARERGQMVAFFLAQTALTVTKRLRCLLREVVASLLYQLAQLHDTLLRSKVDILQDLVRSDAWASNDSDLLMSELQPVLLGIFSEFAEGSNVTLVIDRLDQCAWEVDEDGEANTQMRRAIEGLLHIAAAASCRVKILLTVDAASSKYVKARAAFPKKEKKTLLLKPEWCQAMEEGMSDD